MNSARENRRSSSYLNGEPAGVLQSRPHAHIHDHGVHLEVGGGAAAAAAAAAQLRPPEQAKPFFWAFFLLFLLFKRLFGFFLA